MHWQQVLLLVSGGNKRLLARLPLSILARTLICRAMLAIVVFSGPFGPKQVPHSDLLRMSVHFTVSLCMFHVSVL